MRTKPLLIVLFTLLVACGFNSTLPGSVSMALAQGGAGGECTCTEFDDLIVVTHTPTGQKWRIASADATFNGTVDNVFYIGPADDDGTAADGPRLSFELDYNNGGNHFGEINFDFIYDGIGYRPFGLGHLQNTDRSFWGGSGEFTINDTTGGYPHLKIVDPVHPQPQDLANAKDVSWHIYNGVFTWVTSRSQAMIMRKLSQAGSGYGEFLRLSPGGSVDRWRIAATPTTNRVPVHVESTLEVKPTGGASVLVADPSGVEATVKASTVANLPAAAQHQDVVYVATDEVSGRVLVISNGTNWVRVFDNNPVQAAP